MPPKHGHEVREGCHVDKVHVNSKIDNIAATVTGANEASEAGKASRNASGEGSEKAFRGGS